MIKARLAEMFRRGGGWLLGGAAGLLAVSAAATTFSEPATVFYGRILAGGGPQPFLLTAGELTWTIRRPDGLGITLTGKLRPLNGGQFSYQLSVPHEALALGLECSDGAIALGTGDQTQSHFRITVNGASVRLLGPAGNAFDVAQARRAATYRLDLEVTLPSTDADSDGVPDWWTTRHRIGSLTGDPDGDGRNNLQEYLNNADPNHDDRVPSLLTKEIRAYADTATVVLLQTVDSDSAPTNLTFTVTKTPAGGELVLRNAGPPGTPASRTLAVGDAFSQADVNQGRLVLRHADAEPGVGTTSFEIALEDENPQHVASTNEVAVNVYRPRNAGTLIDATGMNPAAVRALTAQAGFGADEQPFVMSYWLGRDADFVIADGSGEARTLDLALPSSSLTRTQYLTQFVPQYGPDRHHVLLGGAGADRLSGSMEDDVLVGGAGVDMLRGNGGRDLFVFAHVTDGNDVIEDFRPAEGDAIDLAAVLVGNSRYVSNYVQLVSVGTNSLLRINADGEGADFDNLVITLAGVSLAPADLRGLVESSSLLTGTKVFAPSVSVVASQSAASENGPVAGEFKLARSGDLAPALTVNLQLTGSAANGVDYSFVDAQATFAPGQSSLIIPVQPYVDAITELSEVVQLRVLTGAGYEVGATATAQVTIEDLAPQISIEALESVASKNDLTPGLFLITRSGVLDRSVLVRLNVAGTATKGVDYQALPTFVNLAAGQTTALVQVNPLTTATLANGMEYVELAAKADATYKVMRPSARVLIIEEPMTFALWRSRNFPGLTGDLSFVATQDPGATGTPTIFRYAFGLNPLAPQSSTGGPVFQMREGHLTVAFRRPSALTDVQYRVEVSDDLATWQSGAGFAEEFVAPEYALQPEMTTFRAARSVTEAPKLFMRVSVIHTP